ncbi:MAG: hypothetical protein ACI82S_003272 [Patiriisocius sp.]|jgi:hypothetical protein
MSKPDFNLMVIFDAIMQEQSVSIAAERLYMTQPSVSISLFVEMNITECTKTGHPNCRAGQANLSSNNIGYFNNQSL